MTIGRAYIKDSNLESPSFILNAIPIKPRAKFGAFDNNLLNIFTSIIPLWKEKLVTLA